MINVASAGVNDVASLSSVWAVMEAARAGASDAQKAAEGFAKGFLPAASKTLASGTHATGFAIGYAVVFPAYLIAQILPRQNAIMYGLSDGGRAGLDLAKESLRPALQPMLSIAPVSA